MNNRCKNAIADLNILIAPVTAAHEIAPKNAGLDQILPVACGDPSICSKCRLNGCSSHGKIAFSPIPAMAQSMHSIFISRFLIISAIAFSGRALAGDITGNIPYQHVIQANESCASCHAKLRNQHAVELVMANDCEECHTSGESSPIVRVADKHFDDPYVEKLQVAPPVNMTAGMRVPMYYKDTRIGKEPNPMVHIPAGNLSAAQTTGCRTRGLNTLPKPRHIG